MHTKTVLADGRRVVVAALDNGDDAVARFDELARAHELGGASFTAIGAFSRAVLGDFDRDRKEYERIPVDEQVEVLSLLGDVALDGDEPVAHAHVLLGRRDGGTCGGHLLEAEVWPTLEVVLTEVPTELRKSHDPQTSMALLDLRDR